MKGLTAGFAASAIVCVSLAWQVSAVNIALHPELEYQTIVGFGGHDPRDQVNTLVNDLGMSAHRAWITESTAGGSSPSWAKLLELKNAGVECFIASPWSPPASFKYNNNASGTDATWNKLSNGLGPLNDYLHPNADPERGGLRNFYPDMAAHLAKYAKDFRTNVGIDLYAISPQNEPAFAQPYPSCVYYINTTTRVNQLRDLVWEMGRKFATDGLNNLKIFVAEDMLTSWTVNPYVQLMMNDTAVARYVGAVAVHGYSNGINPAPTSDLASKWGGRSGAGTYAIAKGLDCWMTETSGYMNWAGGQGPDGPAPGAQELGVAMYASLKYGKLSGWWWWRLAVTESYWIDEALIYNGQKLKTYHVSKHFYKYIRPGAVMINVVDTADSELGCVAFRHKQNRTLCMVFVNSGSSAKSVTLTGQLPSNAFSMYLTDATRDWAQQSNVQGSTLTVPANSFVTLFATGYDPVVSVFEHVKDGKFTPNALSRESTARVYAMDGSLVRTVRNPQFSNERLVFDGRSDHGARLAAGTYYAVITDKAGLTVASRLPLTVR